MRDSRTRESRAGARRIAWVLVLLAGGLLSCSKKEDRNPISPGPSQSPGPSPIEGTLSLATVVSASDADFPVFVTAPPGDSRLFIVEKAGRIRIRKNGAILATPFLDIASQVLSDNLEQGMLGLAFDPAYAVNRRFYVSYVDQGNDLKVSRFTSSTNPDVAAGGEQVLITIPHPAGSDTHYGGMVVFGPDGKLWISAGDGGGADDPENTGQDPTDWLGSILRIDVSGGAGYTIPSDNPFAAPNARELWSYGLRNPWRITFDRLTGDLYIADVGQGNREEVDVAPAAGGRGRGANYGWSVLEGTRCNDGGATCDASGKIPPTLEYDHVEGCSISGGYVYRGAAIPWLQGTYFYGDYCQGWVRSFKYVGGAATQKKEWPTLYSHDYVVSIGEDGQGELYVVTQVGTIYRIVSP